MTQSSNQPQFILYKTEDGAIKIDTIFHFEKVFISILEHTTEHGIRGASHA